MSYKETMIRKYGSLELWKAHMAKIGSKGGSNGVGHLYAHGKISASENGSLGGKHSKRGYKFIKDDGEYMYFVDNITNEVVKYNHDRTLENHKRSTTL